MEKITARRVLISDEEISFSQHTLLLINSNTASSIAVSSKDEYDEYLLTSEIDNILVTGSAIVKVLSGTIRYWELDCPRLVKLQVFLDQAKGEEVGFCHSALSAILPSKSEKDFESRNIEYWYVNQMLNSTPLQHKFSSILRSTEWYQLVHFLLMESEELPSIRIQDMCTKYGLSLAHFRRLSSYALGKTTKSGLRDWRLVRALLDFSGGDKKMTTVAMDYGYSSLSHFSYEVKDTFGISVRDMKQIITEG